MSQEGNNKDSGFDFHLFPKKGQEWAWTDHLKWLFPLLTTAGAGIYGYNAASKKKFDETDDDFRKRKIKNALKLALGGAIGSSAATLGATLIANAAGDKSMADDAAENTSWTQIGSSAALAVGGYYTGKAWQARADAKLQASGKQFTKANGGIIDLVGGGDIATAAENIRAGNLTPAQIAKIQASPELQQQLIHVAGGTGDVHNSIVRTLNLPTNVAVNNKGRTAALHTSGHRQIKPATFKLGRRGAPMLLSLLPFVGDWLSSDDKKDK